LVDRGILDPRITNNFVATPNWKPQAKSLMKKDSTEGPFPQSIQEKSKLRGQFKEFHQFKAMMGK